MASMKRKRVILSIDKKLEILSKLDKGLGLGQVAKEYNVGKSTVFDIRKQENKIRLFANEAMSSGSLERRYIVRRPNDEKFDKAMHLWFCQQRAKGTPISSRGIMRKAKIMYGQMYPERDGGQFKASSGWLHRFKSRHGIDLHHLNTQGETLDMNLARTNIERFMQENSLTPDQVFNCGETGLYWRLRPVRTLANGSEKQATFFKASKHRVTLMATANASGDFRLPLVFVHAREEPRCFDGVAMSALPCHYYTQRGAWMSGDIFSDWFLKHFVPSVKEYLRRKSLPLRAILLIDSTPAHHAANRLVSETEDGYIQCMFLPANIAGLVQPVDQGVLENLKRRYKWELLRRLWTRSESFESHRQLCSLLTVKDALYLCAKAWEEVSTVLLRHSWRKLLSDRKEDENIEEVDRVSFADEERQFANSAEEEGEWLGADKNEGGHGIFADQEIIKQACEAEQGRDVEAGAERISHAVAEMCLLTSLRWLEQQPDASPPHLQALLELHAFALRKTEMDAGVPAIGTGARNGGSVSERTLPEPDTLRWIRRKEEELRLRGLNATSAAPKPGHAGDPVKVEVDDTGLPVGAGVRPDRTGAEAAAVGHVIKTEPDGQMEEFNCAGSCSDKMKCEPTEISISDHTSAHECT